MRSDFVASNPPEIQPLILSLTTILVDLPLLEKVLTVPPSSSASFQARTKRHVSAVRLPLCGETFTWYAVSLGIDAECPVIFF